MISRKLHRLAAVLVGALAAGVPIVAIHHGLNAYVERQAAEEVRLAAQRAVARAEWRISQTIGALAEIGQAGLKSCDDIDFDAVRRAMMTTTPIKEISVFAATGAVKCPAFGPPAQAWPLSRELTTADDRAFLAVVRLRDLDRRALRVTWRRAEDPLSLVAYIPFDMFLPDASSGKAASEPVLRVMLSEGTLIAAPFDAQESAADDGGAVIAQNHSTRYPLAATATVARAAVFAEQHDLLAIGSLGSGALALLIITFAILLPLRTRADPITEMELALEAKEFVPYYQPLVDLRSGKIVGAEVLMRWRKSDGTLVPPAAFIPQAEASGLILPMTRALMVAVRDEFAPVLGPRPHISIGFNLTARHFASEDVVEEVREVFAGSPIRLSQIVLEVTERQPLDDLDMARRVIAALQALGCQVAIDDVGTGHGGLSYMLKLGVDFIKIDKMFVDAIGTERYSTTIIEMLIDLSRNMGMKITAEGVETFEQVAYLRQCGIYLAQGYVFAPPLPGPLFRQLLEAVHPLAADAQGMPKAPAATPPAIGEFMAARDRVAAA